MCHPSAFFLIADSLSCSGTILCMYSTYIHTDCGLTRALKGVRLINSAPSMYCQRAANQRASEK